ncbi:hypothetical protein [Oryzomonas rubra]|nr:hypothetical protein [Oryzomonas rubra]
MFMNMVMIVVVVMGMCVAVIVTMPPGGYLADHLYDYCRST